jgi:two-component system, LuxR family, sensor kinase FixL
MQSTAEPNGQAGPLARLYELTLGGAGGRAELEEALAELQEALAAQGRRVEALQAQVEGLEARSEQANVLLAQYRELFEFAPDAYLVTDPAGIIQQVNLAAVALFGCPKEFLAGKPLPFYMTADSRRDFFARLARLSLQRETGLAWGACLRPPRGGPVDVDLTVTVVPGPEGKPGGLRWLVRDVTARRVVEEGLRAEKAFTEGLIETAQALVLVLSPGGELLRTNAYLESFTGYPREELGGHAWYMLLLEGGERERVLQDFRQVVVTRSPLRATYRLQTRGGASRVIAWSAKPQLGVGGEVRTVLAVGHDITGLQEAQQQALRLERLAAIGQVSAGLAHESRNALQRGQACLERLRWKLQGQPEALDLLARAQQAQHDLVRLYEDVREYAAPVKVEPAPCDLAAVWRQAWAEVLALAPGRDARLEAAAGECLVCGDAFRLGQVFRNLFENSLTACPGPVCVTVACGPAELGGGPALRVAVRDNGPGLSEEQRRRVFEPFFTTKVKGTGLGLAIVKRIVEAHGGTVTVGGAPAGGAEIVFTLPRGTS